MRDVEVLRADYHTSLGRTYWFVKHYQNTILIYEELACGNELRLVKSYTVAPGARHFAIAKNNTELMMYYQIRSGANEGTWKISITDNGGLPAFDPVPQLLSSKANGTEVIWLPGLNLQGGWALYRTHGSGADRRIKFCPQ